MGFLQDAGYFAGGLGPSAINAYGTVVGLGIKQREAETADAYRKMQEAAIQAQLDQQQAVKDMIEKMNTPVPVGPTPTQQYGAVANYGAQQNLGQQQGAELGGMLTPGLPQAGMNQGFGPGSSPSPSPAPPIPPMQSQSNYVEQNPAMLSPQDTAAKAGQQLATSYGRALPYQQQYAMPQPMDAVSFLKGLAGANPSQAHYYATAMATAMQKQGLTPQEWMKDTVVSGKYTPQSASDAYNHLLATGDLAGATAKLDFADKPGNTLTPFMTPGKKTVLLDLKDPASQDKINSQNLQPVPVMSATIRTDTQAPMGSAPGVFYTRTGGPPHIYISKADGSGFDAVPISSDQAALYNLKYKEAIPTETTKVMQQFAPKVIDLAEQLKKKMNDELKNLGPVQSRARALWSQKIGSADPAYTAINTDANLLSSLLMRMHVGARGGVEMQNHFKDLFATARLDPVNLNSALDETIRYAKKTSQSNLGGISIFVPSGGGMPTSGIDMNAVDDQLRKRGLL